jgi:hypothetical protein
MCEVADGTYGLTNDLMAFFAGDIRHESGTAGIVLKSWIVEWK